MQKKIFSALSLIFPILAYGITAGNGVIVDSSATDYYNHITNNSYPSLYRDIQTHAANIQYVFPDFGYITFQESSDLANGAAINSATTITIGTNASCSPKLAPITGNNTIEFVYTLCNYPQIQRPYQLPHDEGYVYPPFTEPDLGATLSLAQTLSYYSSMQTLTQKTMSVAPFFTYDPNWIVLCQTLYQKNPTTLTNALNSLAQNIASTISTSGAGGVGFDNEPGLDKIDNPNNDPDIHPVLQYNFFKTIASSLGPNQTLFVFDANTTLQSLYQANVSNVVVLYALYDFESATEDGSPYGPYTLSAYGQNSPESGDNVYHIALNALNLATPFMYVLPGSATQTLWDSVQVYNTATPSSGLINSSSVSSGACNTQTDPTGEETNVLSDFLCVTNNTSPPSNTCPGSPSLSTIQSYLATTNCTAYTNTVNGIAVPQSNMEAYFKAALAAISAAKTTNPTAFNSYYKGSVLYTWRIPTYADFSCANHYYSQFSTKLSQCIQILPSMITDTVWTDFANWTP